jgi:hypothetical protein
MSNDNIFLQGTKQGLRFDSPQGSLTIEDLWNIPLTTSRSNRASIEVLGASLLKTQRDLEGAGSILSTSTSTPEKRKVDLQVAILRKVAEVRQLDNAAKVNAAKKREEKETLLQVIAERELKEASIEDLKKRAASL